MFKIGFRVTAVPIGSGPCYQSIGPGSNPAYTNEYFQYLSVLFCSAQEIQTSSNLKSLPPNVVAHDLRSLCDFKQIKKKIKKKKFFSKNFNTEQNNFSEE
ncbi:Protein of unknown function [Cotesia congregata]|uniref:Uncharacterized protein n=1 Tax=Cotesia congregata TaxID=51543 RepID=A0A8J2HIK0_COTCN|nr:Protein of unknown function [Cotesia congregata]